MNLWPSKHSKFSKKYQHRDWQYYGPLRTWPAGSWNKVPSVASHLLPRAHDLPQLQSPKPHRSRIQIHPQRHRDPSKKKM